MHHNPRPGKPAAMHDVCIVHWKRDGVACLRNNKFKKNYKNKLQYKDLEYMNYVVSIQQWKCKTNNCECIEFVAEDANLPVCIECQNTYFQSTAPLRKQFNSTSTERYAH